MFYYVYKHYDFNGELFYVGKGSNKRAWCKQGRSLEWQERATNGFTVEIVAENLQERDALHLEHCLIMISTNLVNKTSGGGPLTPVKPVYVNIPEHKKNNAHDLYLDFARDARTYLLAGINRRKNPRTAIKARMHQFLRKVKDRRAYGIVQKETNIILKQLRYVK